MASGRTVRQVKHGERLRRIQSSLNQISTSDIPLTAIGNSEDDAKTGRHDLDP